MLFGCNEDKVKRPDNIIEKDKFAAILADIHLVEATYLQGRKVPDSSRDAYLEDYNAVFVIHDVEKDQFFANFKYYSDQPKLLKQIYENVHARLQVQQDEIIHHYETGKSDTAGKME